jgi:hypothetical protein
MVFRDSVLDAVEDPRLAIMLAATNRGSAALLWSADAIVAGCQHWTKATELALGVVTSDFEVPGANVVHSV